MLFRRELSKEDQGAFDRMFTWAKQQLQSEVQLGRPWGFVAVLIRFETPAYHLTKTKNNKRKTIPINGVLYEKLSRLP